VQPAQQESILQSTTQLVWLALWVPSQVTQGRILVHYAPQGNLLTVVEALSAKTVLLGISGQVLVVLVVCLVELACLRQSRAQQVAPVAALGNILPSKLRLNALVVQLASSNHNLGPLNATLAQLAASQLGKALPLALYAQQADLRRTRALQSALHARLAFTTLSLDRQMMCVFLVLQEALLAPPEALHALCVMLAPSEQPLVCPNVLLVRLESSSWKRIQLLDALLVLLAALPM